jgi:hypothetical protein
MTLTRRTLVPLGLLPAVALLADCNLIIGAGNYHTAPPTCGAFAFAPPGCDTCLDGACCAEAEACRASSLCAPLFDCLGPCAAEDVVCHGQCYARHRELDATATAMITCQAMKCTAPCIACGNQGVGQTQPCADCVFANCCAEEMACAKNQACGASIVTLGSCADPACALLNQAALATFNATPLVQALSQCVAQSCSATCTTAAQSPWGCTGKYSFSQGPAPSVQFNVLVTGGASGAGLDGVTIQACNASDVSCSPPVGHATPASPPMAGLYTVTVPNGFDGYLLTALAGNATVLEYPGYTVTDTALNALAAAGSQALLSFALLPTPVFDQYLGLSGITGPATLHTAAVSVSVAGCFFEPEGGVQFVGAPGSAAIPFYFTADNSPATNLTATLANGRGGLVLPNVATGALTTITGKVASSGQIVVERTVVVLPGAITEIAYFLPLTQ